MKKQKICPICKNNLEKGKASFAFPRLPESYRYRKLAGIVHLTCLIESPEVEAIRNELTEVLKHSPYPIVCQDGKILILNHERDKCFVIYDFEDFAIFQVPHSFINEILTASVEKELNLDINGFVKLLIDSNLQLTILKPFSNEEIRLSSLPLKRMKIMFGDFLAKQKTEYAVKILINQIGKIYFQSRQSTSRFENIPLSRVNNKEFRNNNLRRGQVSYGTV